jgi:hypothetical protein
VRLDVQPSGLTNLVFCRPGTGIVALFPPTYINPCYWVLADHLGLRYHACWGEGEIPPEPPPGHNVDEWFWSFVGQGDNKEQNIIVDVEGLVTLVRGALDDKDCDARELQLAG